MIDRLARSENWRNISPLVRNSETRDRLLRYTIAQAELNVLLAGLEVRVDERGRSWLWMVRVVVTGAALMLALLPRPAAADDGVVGTLGRHFAGADGRPRFVVGVNYVGAPDRSWTMWEDGQFDARLIGDDLTRAAAAGASVVRIFVRNPLQREIMAGRWNKLDAVVGLARQRGMRLLITFHDYAEQDLAKVSDVIRAVAGRYAGEPVIFGYDLQNEPHLSDLLSAQYPSGPPPLLTDALVKAYGERVSQTQANAWRLTDVGRAIIPVRLSDREAYYGANAYRIYQQLVAEAGDWVVASAYVSSTLDYLSSPDGTRWQSLLNVLDGTLAAWLRPQLAALRAGDTTHLVTVGYSDQILAGLPANGALNFVSLHKFPNQGAKALEATLGTLLALQQRFPDKPVVLEEIGYPTATRDAAAAAVDEAAAVISAYAANLGGTFKWSLNDVSIGSNPREQSFGLYGVDGSPKPAARALKVLADYFAASRPLGGKVQLADDNGGVRFTYEAADAMIVGGRQSQDSRLSFAGGGTPGVVAVQWAAGDRLNAMASTATTLVLNARRLLGDAGARLAGSYAMADGRTGTAKMQAGTVSFAAEAGGPYELPLNRSRLDAKLQIVWPQGGRPVAEAQKANVGAALFAGGTQNACGEPATALRLWRSLNNGVEEIVSGGLARGTQAGGVSFTTWDFNNVDVSAARDPANKYYFRLSLDGQDSRTNVWSHASDARTYFPTVDVPTAVGKAMPSAVDAKIQIVWPHDNLPVDKAEQVNIVAYVFQHGTTTAVPVDWDGTVRLWRSLNNAVGEPVAVGRRVLKTAGNLSFPVWQFDNVDVSAARDALNKYYFRLTVDQVPGFSNVWSHGKDGRTYFPKMDAPVGVCAG